jgi:hypothetical protein
VSGLDLRTNDSRSGHRRAANAPTSALQSERTSALQSLILIQFECASGGTLTHWTSDLVPAMRGRCCRWTSSGSCCWFRPAAPQTRVVCLPCYRVRINPGQVSNEIFSGLAWLLTLLAAASSPLHFFRDGSVQRRRHWVGVGLSVRLDRKVAAAPLLPAAVRSHFRKAWTATSAARSSLITSS